MDPKIPLCFTVEQSIAKLDAIAAAHASIFDGLSEFLATSDEAALMINPGNHDVDFFWPEVRSAFVHKVCKRNQHLEPKISFNLHQVYRRKDSPNIWIEHGHLYDPANWFYVDEFDASVGSHSGRKLYWDEQNPPIFNDTTGKARLFECLGTRFLIKFLNSLDEQYPFVDNVKPFKKFLNVFGASAFVRGYGPIKAALAVWRMTKYLAGGLVIDPAGMLGNAETEIDPVAGLLAEQLNRLAADEMRELHAAISARGFASERSALTNLEDPESAELLLTFFSENLDLLDCVSNDDYSYLESADSSEDDGYLTLRKGFNVDETKELTRAAEGIIQNNGVDLVVMGHTHEPVRDPRLSYFNTGSWTRNYDFADERFRSWEILRADSYNHFPYELNYVEILDSIKPARMETYARSV